MNNLNIGDIVETVDGHKGTLTKIAKVTGRGLSVNIKENNGQIWYCPIEDINGSEGNINE